MFFAFNKTCKHVNVHWGIKHPPRVGGASDALNISPPRGYISNGIFIRTKSKWTNFAVYLKKGVLSLRLDTVCA